MPTPRLSVFPRYFPCAEGRLTNYQVFVPQCQTTKRDSEPPQSAAASGSRHSHSRPIRLVRTVGGVGALNKIVQCSEHCAYFATTETVTLISEVPRVLTDVPDTWRMKASRPSKLELAWYENPGPLTLTCPDLGGEVNFTPSILITP